MAASATIEVLAEYLTAGGVLVFNTGAPFDWFYYRLLRPLIVELGARSRVLANVLLVLSGGKEIYVFQDGAYRLRTDQPVTVYQLSPLTYQIDPPPAECPVGTKFPGGVVPQDYVFHEGEDGTAVRFAELFGAHDTLVLYSYMYGPAMQRPCPSCTSMLDSLDGQVSHITQEAALAVVAQSPIAR